jgi:hypothetical protein
MVTFVKLNEEDDTASIVVGNDLFLIIKRNDTGISVDYYSGVEPDEPFKSDQIWFDDLKPDEE